MTAQVMAEVILGDPAEVKAERAKSPFTDDLIEFILSQNDSFWIDPFTMGSPQNGYLVAVPGTDLIYSYDDEDPAEVASYALNHLAQCYLNSDYAKQTSPDKTNSINVVGMNLPHLLCLSVYVHILDRDEAVAVGRRYGSNQVLGLEKGDEVQL